MFLLQVTNELYRREVRFLHRPEDYFRELGIVVDQITNVHEAITQMRAADWAEANGLMAAYHNLCVNHLQTHQKPPKKVEIQRIPLALLLLGGAHTPGELDDGLMRIGTEFCFNHDRPLCKACPVSAWCKGCQENAFLIQSYRT